MTGASTPYKPSGSSERTRTLEKITELFNGCAPDVIMRASRSCAPWSRLDTSMLRSSSSTRIFERRTRRSATWSQYPALHRGPHPDSGKADKACRSRPSLECAMNEAETHSIQQATSVAESKARFDQQLTSCVYSSRPATGPTMSASGSVCARVSGPRQRSTR